jgi:hypothetical protein
MKTIKALVFLLSLVCAIESSATNPPIAIVGASVIPMNTEQVLADQTILIKDGLIEKVGTAKKTKVPRGYKVIDGKGKFVMPGLFDMHTHFFKEQGDHRHGCETDVRMMVANGLTTVRVMAGHPEYLAARQYVKEKKWTGPELFVASPQFVGRWPWMPDFKNYEIVNSTDKATEAVARFKKEGYDAIKLTFMVAPEVYEAVIDASKKADIKVVGHVGPQVKLPRALRAKQQIEHMDEFIDMLLADTSYNHGQSVSDMNIWRRQAWETVPHLDESRLPELVSNVKAAGIYVTPTNYFFFSSFGEEYSDEYYKSKPDYEFIPEDIIEERWKIRQHYWNNAPPAASRARYIDLRKKMTFALWKAGVPLMAGSDSPEWFLVQGIALHDELATFVSAGLSPFAALETATVNPAKYLGIDHRTGTIVAGKEADLILLEKNPLVDIANTKAISGVMTDGEWIDAASIDKIKAEARNR